MSLRERTRPGLGIIEPCLPSPAKTPPSGAGWLHEIKHDGFRILARRDSAGVRLITRAGNDLSGRFPFIAMAVSKLPVRSCLIDGEAIVCDENGLAVFELIRRHGALASAVLCAFDLLELDGRDLRREPIEKRKALLAKLLKGQQSSIVLNEVYEEDGAIVFCEALQARLRGDRVQTARLNLSPGSVAALDEGQKSKRASGNARGGGGLGPVKIAILSASDVAGMYTATLMERGHQIMLGPFGHVPTAVRSMMDDGIDGVLILTDDDDNLKEIAARFTRETGRPVWHNLTEIPR